MKLNELLKNVNVKKIVGKKDINIVDITIKSKEVQKGSMFICINGENTDSHIFSLEVEKDGAIAIVVERELKDLKITQIIVEDSRKELGIIASNFYKNPEKKLKIIGITGTNGKTTTSFMIRHIFEYNNIKCGVIGTLGIFYNDKFIETNLTTPDPIELFKYFSLMANDGIKIVCMEVSAHSLFLRKVDGIIFDIGIFTNLTQDHLDFFSCMEEYKSAKLKLFKKCKGIVANIDDEMGYVLSKKYKNVITYGIENPSDNFAIDIVEKNFLSSYILNVFDNVYEIKSKLLGKFNIYNTLSAVSACLMLGVKTERIKESIESFSGVKGRLEMIYDKDFKVFIDYAHTPDGLKKSILTLKKYTSGKLICVFGCGGNRDTSKRKIMGEISGEYSDFTIITTDNPRYEEPFEIILQIEEGIKNKTKNYVLIEDRIEGIKYAIKKSEKGDIVLIAGKGSENYQEVLGIKHEYNDKNIVDSLLNI